MDGEGVAFLLLAILILGGWFFAQGLGNSNEENESKRNENSGCGMILFIAVIIILITLFDILKTCSAGKLTSL